MGRHIYLPFVFTYAKSRFPHDAAHISLDNLWSLNVLPKPLVSLLYSVHVQQIKQGLKCAVGEAISDQFRFKPAPLVLELDIRPLSHFPLLMFKLVSHTVLWLKAQFTLYL